MKTNETIITYFGQPMRVMCDRNCAKAWGINGRPYKQFSDDPDDIMYFSDTHLGIAPIDPGTYEGEDGKPLSPDEFPQKWCVRECERCEKFEPGEPISLTDWNKPVYNQPWKHF